MGDYSIISHVTWSDTAPLYGGQRAVMQQVTAGLFEQISEQTSRHYF